MNGLPIGAGFRVPCIIVSPWTAGGWVSARRSTIPPCFSFWRTLPAFASQYYAIGAGSTFGDLTSAFRFEGNA